MIITHCAQVGMALYIRVTGQAKSSINGMLQFQGTRPAVHLLKGEAVSLGRETALNKQLLNSKDIEAVSRDHCQLELLQERPLQVRLITLSKTNPTLVLRSGNSEPEWLFPGKACVLSAGDQLSVTPEYEGQRITLTEQQQQQTLGSLNTAAPPPAIPAAAPAALMTSPAAVADAGGGGKPVMLVLIGVPGAGKSRFSQLVSGSAPPGSWVVVNQDTISNGKAGTRKQCLKAVELALAKGQNVIIDRCNADESQRKDFTQMARDLSVPLHAVVLALSFKLCLSRALARTDHPTINKENAGKAVGGQQSALNKGLPSSSEGFKTIMTCSADTQVDIALKAWQLYASEGADPWLHWSERSKSKPGSISSFFSARQAASAGGPSTSAFGASTSTSWTQPSQGAVSDKVDSRQPTGSSQKLQGGVKRARVTDGTGNASPVNPSQPSQPSASSTPSATMPKTAGEATQATAAPAAVRSAFDVLMKGKPDGGSPGGVKAAAGVGQPSGGTKFKHAWQHSLYIAAMDPSRLPKDSPDVHVDELVVMIPDKYPKGVFHQLVIPRQKQGLDSVEDLTPEHLPLLAHMRQVATTWLQGLKQQGRAKEGVVFRLGFHAVPSMRQLHMHVISQDLRGTGMKRKEHYLSFATSFFMPLDLVEQQLRAAGSVDHASAATAPQRQGVYKCHRCGRQSAPGSSSSWTFPALMQHLATCSADVLCTDAVHV